MIVHKLNESYSAIEAEPYKLKQIYDFLTITTYDIRKIYGSVHRIAKENHFGNIQNGMLLVQNGTLQMLGHFGVPQAQIIPEYTEEFIDNEFKEIIKNMPFVPYDYQLQAAKESVLHKKHLIKAATGSGKSCIIYMIISFLKKQQLKGALIVPNINLLEQMYNDFKDYNATDELLSCIDIQGGGKQSDFKNDIIITTWQSLMNKKEHLDSFEYIITDEVHKYTGSEVSSIIKGTINSKYKIGLTGTIPEDPLQKMELFGLFGLPRTYITSRELIDRGLATPIKINTLILDYNKNDKNIFNELKGNWQKQLKFIKEHEQRNELVVNLTCRLSGNSLVLFQHLEHGKSLFLDIMKKMYPDVEVPNNMINGKKSFEFQNKYQIYFISGADDAKTREQTRKIMEEHENAILVSNYQLLSTGVNLKKLHSLVLASPLKAYTTITQSIGRMLRLHHSKKEALVFDIVDNFGYRKPGGIFYKQYIHRKNTSYNPEQYPVTEKILELK